MMPMVRCGPLEGLFPVHFCIKPWTYCRAPPFLFPTLVATGRPRGSWAILAPMPTPPELWAAQPRNIVSGFPVGVLNARQITDLMNEGIITDCRKAGGVFSGPDSAGWCGVGTSPGRGET